MEKKSKKFKNYRTNFVRLLLLTIILSLMIPVISTAQSGKANFSGTWELNADKSNLGDNGGRRFGGGNFVAKQEANLLTVDRTMTNRDGETININSKYTLDGKESTNTRGNFESKSTANWSSDGKTLTIVTKMSFNGNDRTSSEVWTLSDAKTLSITSTRQNRDGEEVKTTRVYDNK